MQAARTFDLTGATSSTQWADPGTCLPNFPARGVSSGVIDNKFVILNGESLMKDSFVYC